MELFSRTFGLIPLFSGTTVVFHSVGASLTRKLLDVLNAYIVSNSRTDYKRNFQKSKPFIDVVPKGAAPIDFGPSSKSIP